MSDQIKFKTELIECLAGEFDFEIKYIQRYHLRLFLKRYTLDFFPLSNRSTVVGSQKWFEIPDIETYIREHYKE